MSEWPYIVAAYVVAWVVVTAYFIYLAVRTTRTLELLRRHGEEALHD
jgi:CcmD family protein